MVIGVKLLVEFELYELPNVSPESEVILTTLVPRSLATAIRNSAVRTEFRGSGLRKV